MRLVDADNARECFGGDGVTGAVMQRMFDSLPTIDAVPVVRCRECKYYHADTGWCDQLSYFQTSDGEPCSPAESMDWKMFQENDYCSMGQRKEADHEVSE